MTETSLGTTGTDYSDTLFLPQTDFPMRAGLPGREPIWLERWERLDIFSRQRMAAAGRPKFVLHDGPPYANGNIHIGHALNKTLKDLVSRSMQMLGYDAPYVPGWDCHGLPIEWRIEEEKYRRAGTAKPDFSDPEALIAFRKECRAYAEHWVDVQRSEFKRLGVLGDWRNPYLTMSYDAEAQIARELMKIAASGQLYRGSKPVMWSVVERTALAEAEVEYQDYESDTIWVKFPLIGRDPKGNGELLPLGNTLKGASIVIWTTTPWTIPANRAISFSSHIDYVMMEVTSAPEGNWTKIGDKLIVAGTLLEDVKKAARVTEWRNVTGGIIEGFQGLVAAHPLRGFAGDYDFDVPLLEGEHVTDDAGTGFVHTAPSHGTDDFEVWMANARALRERGIDTAIPFAVDDAGFYTKDAPGFEGARVIDDNGKKGDANARVIAALAERGMLVARGRLKHQYPHSWRSKKPVIFRNTPQWFVYMDKPLEGGAEDTLRHRALRAIEVTKFYPPQGQNRLRSMIAERPDWVLSRQRAWGVPITVFVDKQSGEILKDEAINQRIAQAFEEEGADCWFAEGAKARFLGEGYDPDRYEMVKDILDVWFDSGSTHAFVLRNRQKWPYLTFPASMYLEGSDQHRGWFHSSLLESCATNGFAPYASVLTHGFTLDAEGRKMSKSLGNTVAPQEVIRQYGADILRLWVAAADYAEDLRIGPEIIKTTVDSYRKLRNSFRWMLGNLAHHKPEEDVDFGEMPELERLMLHRLAVLDGEVRAAYQAFDYKRVVALLSNFMNVELSAFYFDIRKDALYCDPISSVRRRAALQVLNELHSSLSAWLAPILPFTMEEVWLDRHPAEDSSVHLRLFPEVPDEWRDDALAAKWHTIREVRRVVTGALEITRRAKLIGSSLEAAPALFIEDDGLRAVIASIDMAEVAITSQLELRPGSGPAEAFRLEDVPGAAVVVQKARGRRCARSWKILPEVGSDPDFPDLSPRDAQAMRERAAAGL